MKNAQILPILLINLMVLGSAPQHIAAQTSAPAETPPPTAESLETIQQDIIALRNEFKHWIQKAEQDQGTIEQHIGDKLTELIELLDTSFPAYGERAAKAAALQTAIEGYNAEIAAFEATVGSIETTLLTRLDQIETALTDLKTRGVPIRRGTAEVPGPGTTESSVVTEAAPNMQFPPGQLFRAAYGFYMDGDYDTAIAGFQKYLFDYPDTQLAGAAQYWIAESLVKVAEYDIALEEYERLITHYPNNDKLPDGYYGKAVALLKLGRNDEARQALQYLVDHYQGSLAAKKAEDRLREMQ